MAMKRMFTNMGSEMFTDHVLEKVQAFKMQKMDEYGNKKIMDKIKTMQKAPKMPDFTAEDREFQMYDKDQVQSWALIAEIDPHFFTDPSKEAFFYKMLQDTKDWDAEDAMAKMKAVNNALRKDGTDGPDGIEKIVMKIVDAKGFLIMSIVTMLGKIWMPKEIWDDIKDVMMMMLAWIFVGTMAKMLYMTTKMHKMIKGCLEEIAIFKERFVNVQILIMKMEMSMVQKGGNVNRLLKMIADKVSELEYRFMDSQPRPTDFGRKITTYLEASYVQSMSYMHEGLRRIMETWANAHDALKDIAIPSEMEKDGIYNAEFGKVWEMGWKCFMDQWAWIMQDAEKNLKSAKINDEQYLWWMQTDAVLKELKEMGMTMEKVAAGMVEMKDIRDEKDEKVEEKE